MPPHHTPTERQIGLVAEIAFSINRLSAVPHEAWATDAASLISQINPEAVVAITVAQFDQSGSLQQLNCEGHHARNDQSLSRAALSCAKMPSLNWWIKASAPSVAILSELHANASWTSSPRGRQWTRLATADMLIGLSRLPGPNERIHIAIEMGFASGAPKPSETDAAILRGVLPLLAGRAGLAFNSHEQGVMISNREVEVLQHISAGKSVRQIAEILGRSEHTIHDHVKSLHRKLGASSRGELIARALGHLSSTRAQEPLPGSRPSVPEERAARIEPDGVSLA